jgi:hypothetical protein
MVATRYSKLAFAEPNPTQYVFTCSLERAQQAAMNAVLELPPRYGGQLAHAILSSEEMWDVLAREHHIQPDSSSIFIWSSGAPESSKVYYNPDESIWFYADYLISFESRGKDSVLVSVWVLSPKIGRGEQFLWRFVPDNVGHGTPILESVESTSLEEYEILLAMGKFIGVREFMPNLRLPQKNAR